LHPRLGLNLPLITPTGKAKEWITHQNWQGEGNQNVDIAHAKPFIDYVGMSQAIKEIAGYIKTKSPANGQGSAAMMTEAPWPVISDEVDREGRVRNLVFKKGSEELHIILQLEEGIRIEDGVRKAGVLVIVGNKPLPLPPASPVAFEYLPAVIWNNYGAPRVSAAIRTSANPAINGASAAMTNNQKINSRDVLEAVTSRRWLGVRRSFMDANSGTLGGFLRVEPLERATGLRFNISSSLSLVQDKDYYSRFNDVFLPNLIAFLRERFAPKIAIVNRLVFDDKKGTTYAEVVMTDKAALASPQGGIDLASKHLNMESSGQKVNITFDPAMIEQFKRGDFSGVKIQILDVVPINLMPLLGLKEDEVGGQLAKA
jgi:hypothetical protein